MMHVEKAFLILNAQPTTAAYSDLYNSEKGTIENKEITVQFNCFIVDGSAVNKAAANYLLALVNNTTNMDQTGKININSWNFNWSISGLESPSDNSKPATINELSVKPTNEGSETLSNIRADVKLTDK